MKEKFNIYKNKPIVIIMMLFMLEPPYLSTFKPIDFVYSWGGLLVTMFLLLLVLISKKKYTSVKWIVAYYGVILLSTILSKGSVYQFMNSNFPSLAMCLMFAMWLERSPETLLECFSVYEVFVYLNLLTIIMFPDGLYNNGTYQHCWLLGYKNPQIRTIMPILCMSMIRSYWKSSKINFSTWCLMAASVLTFILNNSATSLVGIVIFLGLFFFINNKVKGKMPKLITIMTGVYISVAAFVAIVILQKQYLFAGIIQNWLHRDLTFTTRVSIWSKSIDLIKKKPILGYGYLSSPEYAAFFNSKYATHPHNYYLYMMMSGGIILLAILFLGFWLANKDLKEATNTATGRIILFLLYSFMAMGITESLTSTIMLYPMMILAMNANNVVALGYHDKEFTIRGKKIKFINGKKRRKIKFKFGKNILK